MTGLLAAALAAADRGIPVLPLHHPIPQREQGAGSVELGCSCGRACGASAKHPIAALVPHGLKDATTDPALLWRWWRRWPQANLGLVTGVLFDVLDLDGPTGRAALTRFLADHGCAFPAAGPVVASGRVAGGWHLYLAATGHGGSQGLLDQVDWRGRGGYVVAPPSRHASGHRYRWLRPLDALLPQVPGPLRQLLEPPRVERAAVPEVRPDRPGHPYGQAVLARECRALAAMAPDSGRNTALWWAGVRLYNLVAGGVLAEAEVQAGLRAAARANGLAATEPAQTERTLRSARQVGLARPRGLPDRELSRRAGRAAPTKAWSSTIERAAPALERPRRDGHERNRR